MFCIANFMKRRDDMKKRALLILALAAVLVLSIGILSGCAKKAETPAPATTDSGKIVPPTWAPELIMPGTILIGADTNYPPFEFSDDGGKTFKGFDVDLMNEMTKRIGLKAEFKTYNFDSLIAGLNAGNDFDMVVSAWTINDKRAEEVNFSNPYFRNDFGVVVAADSDLKSVKDLKSGDTVSVQTGSSAFEWAEKELAPKGINLKTFENTLDCFNSLSAGDAVMVIQDLAMASEVAKDETRKLKVIETIAAEEFFGLGFSKTLRGENMRKSFNSLLDEISHDGTYAEIYKKWFGTEPTFLPSGS